MHTDNLPAAVDVARKCIAAQLEAEARMTPGPWDVSEPWDDPNGGYTISPRQGDAYIADVYAGHHPDDECTFEIGTANASGIAASRNQWRALLLGYDELLAHHYEHWQCQTAEVALARCAPQALLLYHTERLHNILARLAPLPGFEPLQAATGGADG